MVPWYFCLTFLPIIVTAYFAGWRSGFESCSSIHTGEK